MSTDILLAYGSKHGSTAEVAQRLAGTLRAAGRDVDVRRAGDVDDLGEPGALVLGSCLYAGRLHPQVRSFLRRHGPALAGIASAVFALGPTSSEESDVEASRYQLRRALEHEPEFEPRGLAIFGGVVDPTVLHFPLSRMQAVDARDWQEIDAWAAGLPALLGLDRQPAGR